MRLATWNIGSALAKNNQESIEYIVENVEKNGIDVLCLQEIVISGGEINYIEEIKKKLNYKHVRCYELSSAHLQDDSKMGIAIFSKYAIQESYNVQLTNPGLTFEKNDKVITSDDKGILIVQLSYEGKKVYIATGHMLPFHSFGSDSIHFKYLYKEMYNKVKSYCNDSPFVLCGDFNTSKLEELISIEDEMNRVFSQPTRYNGKQNDYIYITKDLICDSYRIIMNDYDHFLCICDIDLRSTSKINLLHLSDIHFLGKDTTIDQKTSLSKVDESDIRKKQFLKRLEDINESIDYVVVSGDITTYGQKEGFALFNKLIADLQKKKKFPATSHFIIVPGNHDVNPGASCKEFSQVLGGNFIRPWIEELDKKPNDLIDVLSPLFAQDIGDMYGCIEDKTTCEKIHFPFLLDVKRKVLIYAFNSSSISSTKIKLNNEDQKIIDTIKEKRGDADAKKVIAILEKELAVDPARIDPREFFLFGEIIKRLSKRINLSTYYKVAVLHHHISTIATGEEIKKFDHITNAGQFKRYISDAGFQIVLHGHKHSPIVFHDTAIENHKDLLVVSGGTVFGYSRECNGFYLHSIDRKLMKTKYMYLDDEKTPDTIVEKLNGDSIGLEGGTTLSTIYKTIEDRIIQHINTEIIDGNIYVGWSKNLEDRKVGVISTVYGLLILEHLKSHNLYYIQEKERIINSLWRFRHASGGWGAVSQVSDNGAPEATAWVVLALYTVQSPLYKQALSDLYSILDRMETKINSNFTLSLIISILCDVDPSSSYIPNYCKKLLDNATKEGEEIKYWCNKCQPELMRRLEPSIVHTASAIVALYKCQEKGIISIDLQKLLNRTRDLLVNEKYWGNSQEAIAIQIGQKEDSLLVHFYTIAWVLRALLKYDCYFDNNIQNAVKLLLKDYCNGYWNYENCYYIWTIYDALIAFEEYLLQR